MKRRLSNEPISKIINKKSFWKDNFYVNEFVLDPRPETEIVIEESLKIFNNKNTNLKILDIGTGSGSIAISLAREFENADILAIDISEEAIKVAKKNIIDKKLDNRIKLKKTTIDSINQNFDLIVSNPPYLTSSQIKNLPQDIKKYEPRIALKGGNDGLDVIKKVIYKSKSILKKKGMLALEIGNGQHLKVIKILKSNNFRKVLLVKDYQDNVRCIISVLEN
mgnify:CR=1 FL=1